MRTTPILHRLFPAAPVLCGAMMMSILFTAGCQDKFDLATLPQQVDILVDTAYVELEPPFGGFTQPEDLMIGNDQLLYVADTKGDRVVMLNRAGQVLSTRRMQRPIALAQDSRLDLLVGGEITLSSGDTAGAVFRLHLVSASADSAHRLEVSPIDTVWIEYARPHRRFPGIAVFGDNSYLVVRTGTDNSSVIDPDARVLLFSGEDVFVTPLSAFATRTGSGITDINRPTSIAAFPGQKDFVLAQSSEGVSYGALWMRFEQTENFDGWLPRFDPAKPEERGIDFIRPNRYNLPEAVAIDRNRRDVFIADAGLDSIVKFNSRGAFKRESFGVVRSNGRMRQPSGLAHFEKVLYVLDREQGLVLRYRLSTDVPR